MRRETRDQGPETKDLNPPTFVAIGALIIVAKKYETKEYWHMKITSPFDRTSRCSVVGFLLAACLFVESGGLLAPQACATEAEVTIVGVAKVDVTPDYPVLRTGINTPTTVARTRLYAKALAFGSDAEGPAVLITLDALELNPYIHGEVVRRLAQKTRVRAESLSICCSHGHATPLVADQPPPAQGEAIRASGREGVRRYTEDLIRWLEQVALAALADRRPSRLSWGAGSVGWARNRRPHWPFTPVDHSAPVLRVDDANGKMRAVLTSYACHATSFGRTEIHGDWVACAQEYIERELPGVVGMVAIGCGGDANPLPRGTWEHSLAYGHSLGAEVKRVALSPAKGPIWNSNAATLRPVSGRVECRTKAIVLPFAPPPSRAEFEARTKDSNPIVAGHAKSQLARLDRGEKPVSEIRYTVQAWAFGRDLAMVMLPGEVVVDYSLRIKREFDASRMWVNAYVNDRPGYIPSERVLREGGYEGGFVMFRTHYPGPLAPGLEEKIMAAVREVVPAHFRTVP